MSELDEQESDFSRCVLRARFDDAVRGGHREALRAQVLSRYDLATGPAPSRCWPRLINQGRTLMRRPLVAYAALAAALLIVAAFWLLVPGQQSAAEAFNAFAGAFVDAKSMKFKMKVSVEGQPDRLLQAYYLAPGRMRQEIDKVVSIIDMQRGQFVTLNPIDKSATVMTMKGRQENKGPLDLFEQMRDLLAKNRNPGQAQYEPLGEKQIAGRRALGFRCESLMGTATLWGDPATGLPLVIESTFSVPRTEVVMSDFDLDPELEESLFDLTPPADYKVRSFDVDASPFTETDLVNAFRVCSDLAGGEFPDAMDTAAINRAILESVKRRGDKGKEVDELMPKLMQQSVSIGRGFAFALQLSPTSEAHYAGKGVKRDAPDRPIFWYKPEDKDKYRVLYADLTFRESDQAPQVQGAVPVRRPAPPKPEAK
jgi:outer membrane lipoprotein-sorting protein